MNDVVGEPKKERRTVVAGQQVVRGGMDAPRWNRTTVDELTARCSATKLWGHYLDLLSGSFYMG